MPQELLELQQHIIASGKIAITSVSAGSATITVTDAAAHNAIIAVTVAADGTITIGTITKHLFSVVNTRTGVDCTAIQTAIDAAISGDTILVKAESYIGALAISTNNLTLKSVNGSGTTIIDASSAKTGISISGTGITVEGFKIINFGDGTNSYAIWVHEGAANATITNNYITTSRKDSVSHGIMVDSIGAHIIGNTIENLSYTVGGAPVSGYASTGIGLWDAQDVLVENNTIDNVEIGIGIYPAGYVTITMSGIVISGNDIKNNTVAGLHFSPYGVILQSVVSATGNTFTDNAIQVEDANTGTAIDLTTILGTNTFSPTSIINGRSIK